MRFIHLRKNLHSLLRAEVRGVQNFVIVSVHTIWMTRWRFIVIASTCLWHSFPLLLGDQHFYFLQHCYGQVLFLIAYFMIDSRHSISTLGVKQWPRPFIMFIVAWLSELMFMLMLKEGFEVYRPRPDPSIVFEPSVYDYTIFTMWWFIRPLGSRSKPWSFYRKNIAVSICLELGPFRLDYKCVSICPVIPKFKIFLASLRLHCQYGESWLCWSFFTKIFPT